MHQQERALNILLKSEDEQTYVANATSNPKILDILANSESIVVKMTVLSNPNVADSTLGRLIGDENKEVWQKTQEIIDLRKKLA